MNPWLILALLLAAVVAVVFSRRAVRPGTGTHRCPSLLLRPVEAMANDLAWCPAEQRITLHAFLRLGGRQCWDCRHVTLHSPYTSTPPLGDS